MHEWTQDRQAASLLAAYRLSSSVGESRGCGAPEGQQGTLHSGPALLVAFGFVWLCGGYAGAGMSHVHQKGLFGCGGYAGAGLPHVHQMGLFGFGGYAGAGMPHVHQKALQNL
jgi:hypothetical protein